MQEIFAYAQEHNTKDIYYRRLKVIIQPPFTSPKKIKQHVQCS